MQIGKIMSGIGSWFWVKAYSNFTYRERDRAIGFCISKQLLAPILFPGFELLVGNQKIQLAGRNQTISFGGGAERHDILIADPAVSELKIMVANGMLLLLSDDAAEIIDGNFKDRTATFLEELKDGDTVFIHLKEPGHPRLFPIHVEVKR